MHVNIIQIQMFFHKIKGAMFLLLFFAKGLVQLCKKSVAEYNNNIY